MYLEESGGPPVLYKWRGLVQDVINNIVEVFQQSGAEEVKKKFPKHICYNTLIEFLQPLLNEFLYQESELEKIMKEFKMLKGIVLQNKTKKRRRNRIKRSRTWRNDKNRNIVKKVRRLDSSSSTDEESSSSDVEMRRTSKGRRQRVFWTEEEEQALIKGVAIYGVVNWVSIHRRYTDEFHPQRTPSDLKDKWRNLQNKKKKASVEAELQKQQQLEQQRIMEQQKAEQQRLYYEHQQELMLHQQQLQQQRMQDPGQEEKNENDNQTE